MKESGEGAEEEGREGQDMTYVQGEVFRGQDEGGKILFFFGFFVYFTNCA